MYGERIRTLRKQRGKTLRDLSEELAIPFTTLGNYEREDREPNLETFKIIADYFQVSIDYLTGRIDNSNLFNDLGSLRLLENLENKLNLTHVDVRNMTLYIFDEMASTLSIDLENADYQELEIIAQVVSFIHEMKIGFVDTSEYVNPYEFAITYRNKKLEIDKGFNKLFDLYAMKKQYYKF